MRAAACGASFNGAPRLGLGEGLVRRDLAGLRSDASMGLRDWVSEKASGSRFHLPLHPAASMGLRDWVSEKAICARPQRPCCQSRFNGAPRLGLGEG